MDSISSVSPSIVLPPKNRTPLQNHRRRITFSSPFLKPGSQFRLSYYSQESGSVRRRCHHYGYRQIGHGQRIRMDGAGGGRGGGGIDEEENRRRDEEVERALHLDGTIPGSSDEFLKQVSSRAYDMRRNLQQTFESSSYDVLEANPWRESSKPVYVLTHTENQLCTMKTRRNRSEVERELGLLFSKGKKWRNQAKHSGNDSKFQMLVEDIREGVLVFEDQNEAAKYCDLLQGGGQDCEGVAEIDASSVFDLCRKMRALAVLFRRGRTPPLPESLKLNLRARKRSLEDQEDK